MTDGQQLAKILQFQKLLTHLDLSRSKAVTNQVLQTIISKLSLLQSLRLSGCLMLTDLGFTGESKWGPKSASQIDSQKICALKHLEELSLGGIMITDKCVDSAFRFTRLRKVNVSMCRYLTDKGFEKIAKLNSGLKILEARWCLLSDEGLQQVISCLAMLTVLDVEGCDRISKKLMSVIPGKLPHLKKLVVSGCNVDTEDVKSVFDNQRPTLRVNFNSLYTPIVKKTR